MDPPILVTGSARSGTSWVGHNLSANPSVRVCMEPFNVLDRGCVCGARFIYSYTYVSNRNDEAYRKHLTHLLSRFSALSAMDVLWETVERRRPRPVRRFLKGLAASRTLVKDPLAVFSTEWLASTFNMKVVITIRHPAAVVNSYKLLGWRHPFSHFLSQKQLMEEHLWPFAGAIENYARTEQDIIDQASLLWKLVYHVVRRLRNDHEDWSFVRHEDLSRSPLGQFESIYRRVGLEFSQRARASIVESSRETNPVNTRDPFSIRRNSRGNVDKWRGMLHASDVARIRKAVEDVSWEFYGEEEW